MARYEKVFSLTPMLYTQGSPVIIEAGALQKDNTNSNIIAQLKFKSIDNNVIKALTIKIVPIDAFGNKDDVIEHHYLDLNVRRNEKFASKQAILIPNHNTRAFEIESINIMFADGTNKNIENAVWETLPTQKALNLKDYEKEYYIKKFKTNKTFSVINHKDLWLCTCGNINNTNEDICFSCKNKLSELTDFDTFKNEALAYKNDKKVKAEEKRIATKNKLNVIKKIAIITIVIVVIGIILGVLYNNVIQPNQKFNTAMEYLENDNYKNTYALLDEIDNKDKTYNKANELLLNEQYQKAYVLFNWLASYKDSNDKAKEILDKYPYVALVGKVITFGTYANEEINWKVINKKNDKILVTTLSIIESKPYNTEYSDITWENCSLRAWLNDDFYNNAFNDTEKSLIQTTKIVNKDNTRYSESGFVEDNIDGGNDTEDNIFLLSIDDAYLYFSSDKERQCKGTNNALSNGLHVYDDGYSCWWLRSPGCYQNASAFIYSDGLVVKNGWYVDSPIIGVRPAMWISAEQ